ncbi:MAG: histidine kinase [Anaerolineaceae bacterium]|nr:histidine kinase [Anaerolineaceae bacterium]
MLNRLRIKLTILYFFVALVFAGLVSFSSYFLIYFYFQNNNDAALRYKMALTFQEAAAPLPPELVTAQQDWNELHNTFFSIPKPTISSHKDDDDDGDDSEHYSSSPVYLAENYEGELSSIFVLPLDINGRLLFNPNPFQPPMSPNMEAVNNAIMNGYDIRTASLNDGSKVRILTYSTPSSSGYGLIQLGKPISDQVRVLNQLMSGLLVIGFISVIILGFGSWWMAGNSLKTTQRALDMQQTFVANASHELRTPLTLVRASAEVATRHIDPTSHQNELMGDIINEVDHMTKLVEDLLLLSRLDAKELKLNKESIELSPFIEDILRSFSHVTESHQVKLIVGSLDGKVIADRTRLRQIILIILDNALRHTPEGNQIFIQSKIEGRMVHIDIQDTGVGIDPQHLNRVFDRFYQVDPSRGGENKGSGLGLSIAKSLTEAHNGQIEMKSSPGKGTTVRIILPFEGK